MSTITTTTTVTVTIQDGQEKIIRVFGHPSDPHFCGKDICEIMELENIKDSLQKMVSEDHKTTLKNLLEEQNNTVIPPSWLGCLKPPTSLGGVDLETLSYHDGRLVVLSEPGIMDLLNGSRKDKNKKILRDAINKAICTIKFENNSGLLDIFSFISKEKLTIDITSDWFQDLWYPLSKVNPPPQGGVGRVENRPIILTQNLLEWMGYKGRDQSDKQERFLRLLDSLKIPYTEIDHKHPLAIEYPHVQKEVKLLPKQLSQKKWICMEPRAFKKVVMRLNTENADIVRDYYINLEEAMFAYGEYTVKYLIRQRDSQLAIKDQEESQLKEQLTIKEEQLAIKDQEESQLKEQLKRAERKAIRVNKFMRRVTIKEKKLEWIYIATTRMYSGERLFKVGSTTRLSSRISGYNTGRPKEDSYYYCWVKKCYNSKDLDYHIQKLLFDFKHRENAELYCGIKFSDLMDIVNFIVDNYDESIDYINNFIKTRLNESLEEDDMDPPRLDYKKITYQIGDHTETIDLEEEDSSVIRDELDNILSIVKEQQEEQLEITIERKKLIDQLAKVTNLRKKEVWSHIKELTGWTSSKKEIEKDDGFKYKIMY